MASFSVSCDSFVPWKHTLPGTTSQTAYMGIRGDPSAIADFNNACTAAGES